MQTFQEFLESRVPSEYIINNSDEGEARWIEQLDVQDVIDFAELYGRYCRLIGEKNGLIQGQKIVNEIFNPIK